MTIAIGDRIPSATLNFLKDGVQAIRTNDLFAGKTVVLFAVPGAFTPTCSAKHLPSFIKHAEELKAKGVEEIVCMSVNDPFVMQAWGNEQGAEGKVTMLPDGNGTFTTALGLTQDISVAGLGVRGKRFSMLVEDGVIKSVNVEEGKGVTVSGANQCLVELG